MLKRPYTKPKRVPTISKAAAALLWSAAIVFCISFLIERSVRPLILRIVRYECTRYAMNAFSEATDENTEEYAEIYKDLYRFQYDPDGSIAAITVDAYAVNRLQAVLGNTITQKLLEVQQTPLELPVGTLTGIQALLGRGPALKLYISPESFVDADVYNKMESAGINQTRLTIFVHFQMNLSVVAAGYGVVVDVVNEQYLGEVLLMGEIPQTFQSWNAGSE